MYSNNSYYRRLHPEKRYLERKEYYARTSYSVNYGKPWTDEEVEMVMKHEITDTELAKKLGRSVASIQTKRYSVNNKIKLIEQIVGGKK